MADSMITLPCGCLLAYDQRTNSECLVLDLIWCDHHRQVTIWVDPQDWKSRNVEQNHKP